MTDLEFKVLDAFKEAYPEPAMAEDIVALLRKPPTLKRVVASAIDTLYRQKYLVCSGGGFLIKHPCRMRSIDAEWSF